MKRKLYKENRYFSLVLLNKHHIFFFPPKNSIESNFVQGEKESCGAIVGMNGQFSKTENS